jgi:hypothetical protein
MLIKCTQVLLAILATGAVAAEPDPKALHDLMVKLMAETKVIAVQSISVPASQYKSDGNPDTLEIVFLTKKSDGPSRVSDDGEVIFLYKASDAEQSTLIGHAFEIRARRRLAEN